MGKDKRTVDAQGKSKKEIAEAFRLDQKARGGSLRSKRYQHAVRDGNPKDRKKHEWLGPARKVRRTRI